LIPNQNENIAENSEENLSMPQHNSPKEGKLEENKEHFSFEAGK